MSNYLFSLSIISLLDIIFSSVVIPFKIYVQNYAKNPVGDSVDDATRLLNEWHTFHLYSKLKIGNPNQEVSIQINVDNDCFELNKFSKPGLEISKLSNFYSNDEKRVDLSSFNLNNSKSFKNVSDQHPLNVFYSRYYFMGNDEIYLYNKIDTKNPSNEIKINDLYFRVPNNKYGGVNCIWENCGLNLGIHMFSKEDDECPNFNKILKQSNLINKYIFSIHYDSQNSGSLIFGAYPHEYYPDKYNEKYLSTFYTTIDSITITNFNLSPDHIISISPNKEESIVSNKTRVIFQLHYGFFIGDYLYQEYIEKNFFNELTKRNICQKNEVNYGYSFSTKYDMYSCNEDNLKDIKQFPQLKFYIKTSNASFIFGFDELFLKIRKKYYFLVIFEEYKNDHWFLGYPFFKKYDIVFNEDSKTISFYTNYSDDGNPGGRGSKVLKIIVIIGLALILIVGAVVIGYCIGKNKFFIRKKRANELTDDDYDYKEGGNIINEQE